MAITGRRFPSHPIVRSFARPYVVPDVSLAIAKASGLVVSGKTLTYSSGAVVTKVVVTSVVQRWNAANWINQTGVCYLVQKVNLGTNVLSTVLATGTNGTTNASGIFSVATTNNLATINDDVFVTLWKQGGGPAAQNIIGASYEKLVAGP